MPQSYRRYITRFGELRINTGSIEEKGYWLKGFRKGTIGYNRLIDIGFMAKWIQLYWITIK